jgi:hypothetical protein
MSSQLSVIISEQSVVINGYEFDVQVLPSTYERVLGPKYRACEYGPPPPVGHRNNKALIFDDFGVYLFQHHSTGLIRGIAFVYETDCGHFQLECGFSGHLDVLGFTMPVAPTYTDIPERVVSEGKHFDRVYNLRFDRLGISFEIAKGKRKLVRAIEVSFHLLTEAREGNQR